jgi:exosome complex component RRP41
MAALLDPIVGLRVDGRKPNELRKIKCEVGVFAQADGSASLSQVTNTLMFILCFYYN